MTGSIVIIKCCLMLISRIFAPRYVFLQKGLVYRKVPPYKFFYNFFSHNYKDHKMLQQKWIKIGTFRNIASGFLKVILQAINFKQFRKTSKMSGKKVFYFEFMSLNWPSWMSFVVLKAVKRVTPIFTFCN